MNKESANLHCCNCGVLLGVLTEKGLLSGNILIAQKELTQENDNYIFCSECGEDIWKSIVPDDSLWNLAHG